MEQTFNSHDYISDLGDDLILEFTRAGKATTAVLVGTAREKAVKDKLGKILPSKVAIATGCVIDSYGNTSTQTDIILYERDHCPLFTINDTAEATYVPCEGVVAIGERTHRERILEKSIQNIRNDFDVIFIDCPPNLNLAVINAILVSDKIIIPVAGKFSLDGVSDLLDTIEEVRDDFDFLVYRNQVDNRNKTINSYIIGQLEAIKSNSCNTYISQSQDIEKANASNLSVLDYNPKSKVINQYEQLIKEILE